MNLKKFISGVSALAIAASAFAAMTITASAADGVVYERGINDWQETDVSENEWVASGTFSTNPAAAEGTGLTFSRQTKNGVSVIKNLTGIEKGDTVQITGTWSPGGATGRSGNYHYVSFGSDVQLRARTQNRDTLIAVNGSTDEIGTININARDHKYTFAVTIDTKTKTLTSFVIDSKERLTEAMTLTNGTVDYIAVGAVAGGSTDSYTQTTTLQDIKIERTAAVYNAATSIKINYLNSADDTALQDSKTISLIDKVEYDTASYSYPKYIVKDGALYVAEDTTYTKSAVLSAGETSVDVKYTATGTTGYFFEGEANGGDSTTITDSRLSGGVAVRHISASRGSYKVITAKVPTSGVYKVTVCGLTNGSGKGSKLTVYKNSADNENELKEIDINKSTINSIKTDEVGTIAIKANESIIVKGNDDNAAVDYVLLEKVGDIASASDVAEGTVYDSEDGKAAKVYTFTVTPNAETVTSVTVAAEGSEESSQTITTPTASGDGSFIFAIIATYEETAPDASVFKVSIN